MSILISLTPAESKRLIGRGLAAHPQVRHAFQAGNILVSNGTTTGYFVEELLGASLDISHFPCGVVTGGVLCQTPEERLRSVMISKGAAVESDTRISDYEELSAFAARLSAGDVYVKGANAIDPAGNAGFFLAHPTGGNIMTVLPRLMAQGIAFLIPAGLEKLVASVPEAQRHMRGIGEYSFTFGRGCGYVTVSNGVIFHEIAALGLLTGVRAWHVGSGGVGGSEGAVSLVVEGSTEQEAAAVRLLKEIKNEPPVAGWKKRCADCSFRCKYRFPR